MSKRGHMTAIDTRHDRRTRYTGHNPQGSIRRVLTPPPPLQLTSERRFRLHRSLVLDAQHRSPRDDRLGGMLPGAIHHGRSVRRSPCGTRGGVAKHTRTHNQVEYSQEKSCGAGEAQEHKTPEAVAQAKRDHGGRESIVETTVAVGQQWHAGETTSRLRCSASAKFLK